MQKSGDDLRVTSGEYLEALNDLWKGNTTGAIERASAALANDAEGIDCLSLYRLWIEALASEGSHEAIRTLIDHMHSMGMESEVLQSSFVALRGIAHLELDEVEAAKFMHRLVKTQMHNVYAAELSQSLGNRFNDRRHTVLGSLRDRVQDYVVLESLARAQVMHGEEREARHTIERCSNVFPGSPLASFFEFHLAMDSGDYRQAGVHANKLIQAFPANANYLFNAAFASLKRSNFDEARQYFEKVASKIGDSDPDTAVLLGHIYREIARRGSGKGDRDNEKALAQLKKASAVLKQNGLPVASAAIKIASLEQELNPEADSPPTDNDLEKMKTWFVKLSPRRFHELVTTPESEIEYLTRAIGRTPRASDVCFFACDDTRTPVGERRNQVRGWKIGAMYAVWTNPMWSPMNGCEHTLKLIHRPNVPIQVDVQYREETITSKLAKVPGTRKGKKDSPSDFGVFEIDEGGLALFSDALERKVDHLKGRDQQEQRLITLKRVS